MLISCDGCNSKIRVPDSAAGKRVKCPKCATMLRVPELEQGSPSAPPEATGIAPAPPPLPKPEPPAPADPDAYATTPMPASAKPPPLKSTRAGPFDDEDDKPSPPRRKRRDRYDDGDDDDDDDLNVRDRRRAGRAAQTNSLAMTSMILGIVSIVSVLGSCCCGLFGAIALVCSIMAIVLGFIGKSPGSEGYALAGIICGSVTLALAVIGTITLIFFIGMDAAFNPNGFNQGFNNGFNQGFNQNRGFKPIPPIKGRR